MFAKAVLSVLLVSGPLSLSALALPDPYTAGEIDSAMRRKDYVAAHQFISGLIQQSTASKELMPLLCERAFLCIAMKLPDEALDDLDRVLSLDQEDNSDLKKFALEALWMRFALASALRDKPMLLADLERLKEKDPCFPLLAVQNRRVTISLQSRCSKAELDSFCNMLKGFGVKVTGTPYFFTTHLVSSAEISLAYAPRSLQALELAAAVSFGVSHWADAAWKHVGSTYAPHTQWKTFGWSEYVHVLDALLQ